MDADQIHIISSDEGDAARQIIKFQQQFDPSDNLDRNPISGVRNQQSALNDE